MSILIKGMEMPKCCAECVAWSMCYVGREKDLRCYDGRLAYVCPLVEVSDVYGWTPISTAEPPGGIHVLVTMQWEDGDLEVTELDYGLLKATRWPHLDKVIAWAPLPEPYKEAQS